jgi:photosystem II stability/assembly factor-like uncharacterized protein
MRKYGAVGVVFVMAVVAAEGSPWTHQVSGTTVSLRGLSVVSDQVAWVSGQNGTFCRTTNGGNTWTAGKVPDASYDFRDIDAFDANTAYVLSAGEPAKIYKTTDGGESWTEQYSNSTPGVFFDSMAFWDAETGVAFSDPIEGNFVIIRTTDGGRTWQQVPAENIPPARSGEAGFAASGTCVATQADASAWIGTGGSAARVLRSTDRGETWAVSDTPMRSGLASTGIFSIAFRDTQIGIVVGGDYQKPESREANAAITADGGSTWTLIKDAPPLGFRSAVAYIPGSDPPALIAVGTSGSDQSSDGGRTWQNLGSEGFHAVRFSPSGKVGWAVGSEGRIAKISVSLRADR